MRPSHLFVALAVAALPLMIACSAETAGDDDAESTSDDALRAKSITQADDGKTVTVGQGHNVVVSLPANPTTGYRWKVTSTDRSFGYPASEKYVASGGAVGSGGVERFTWKTNTPFALGQHTVSFEYKRPWDTNAPPAQTFSVTVDVTANCPQVAPPAPGFCQGGNVKPRYDANGCLTGYDCDSSCGGCAAGSSCKVCWGNMACVPNGALC